MLFRSSLLALKALSRINERFRSQLRAIDLYQSPTVWELAERIRVGRSDGGGSDRGGSGGRRSVELLVDLTREAVLEEDIRPALGGVRGSRGAVLLTGGTGFVGRFLLRQLLQDTDARIYCLVRNAAARQALSRLEATLSRWSLWREEYGRRIVPVAGDLGQPRLGISETTYQELCREVDDIYHCGTRMNHLEPFESAREANVQGVRELLRLATSGPLKGVNYISTLGVFSGHPSDAVGVVDESTPIEHQRHPASRGYTASKWVGEKIIMTAAARGVPCNIFRLGLVWADTRMGRYDELQWGYRLIKSSLLSGFAIQDYHYEWAPTPVDYVSRAVVALADRHRDGGGLFHLSSSSQMEAGLFERCNALAGTALQLVSFYQWTREMKRLHQAGTTLPEVPLIEFAFSMDEAEFREYERSAQSARIRFDCTRTQRELESYGIAAPALDDLALGRCLEDMFLRDPELREWHQRRGH